MTTLLVMLGAALGAAARYLVDGAVQSRHQRGFPFGTLLINVSGSLLLGLLLGAAARGHTSAHLLAFAATGVCGGFTTFSTFSYETVLLGEDGRSRAAVLNVVASVGLGLLAAALGYWATSR